MHRLTAIAIVTLFTVAAFRTTFANETIDSPRGNARQQTDQLMEIFTLVLDHHLAPPSMQQMVLEFVAASYGRAHRQLPPELAIEISNAVGRDAIREILQREVASFPEPEVAKYILNPPPGLTSAGVTVTSTKLQRVNEQFAANRYVGLGITIGQGGVDRPSMVTVFPDGPADRVGAEPRDEIVSVDGRDTTGIPLEQVVDWLRGVEGSDVELVLFRKGVEHTLTMTRSVVPLASIEPMVTSKSGDTVGIKINRVAASNVHELREIDASLDEQVQRVVLDFRGANGQDNLHYGKLLGSALIDGDAIGSVTGRDGGQRPVVAEPGTIFAGRELVVVVDRSTKGVLKWIAAAVQDSGRGLVLGDAATVSATTRATKALSCGTLAVSMPTHGLSRANGDSLVVRKGGLIDFGQSQNAIVMSPAVANSARQTPGVLDPDKPFPKWRPDTHLPRFSPRPSAVPTNMPLRHLASVLESLEKRSISKLDSQGK